MCFKSIIQSGCSLFLSKMKTNTSLKLPVGVSPLQLVDIQKSEIFRHKTSHMVLFIIFLENKHNMLLHLSIFYEYQQFAQHRICFSIQPPDYSDPWPTLERSTSLFLIMLFNYFIRLNKCIRLLNMFNTIVFYYSMELLNVLWLSCVGPLVLLLPKL